MRSLPPAPSLLPQGGEHGGGPLRLQLQGHPRAVPGGGRRGEDLLQDVQRLVERGRRRPGGYLNAALKAAPQTCSLCSRTTPVYLWIRWPTFLSLYMWNGRIYLLSAAVLYMTCIYTHIYQKSVYEAGLSSCVRVLGLTYERFWIFNPGVCGLTCMVSLSKITHTYLPLFTP